MILRRVFRAAARREYDLAVANVRWVRVAGFPYRIYFRVSRSRIEVFAVFHVRRDPAVLMRR